MSVGHTSSANDASASLGTGLRSSSVEIRFHQNQVYDLIADFVMVRPMKYTYVSHH